MTPPTLLFQHMPKTAGTSVRAALDAAYPESERLYVYDWDDQRAVRQQDLPELPADQRRRFRLIIGHFQFGIHEHVPTPSSYVTMLRDPLERVVSLYCHFMAARSARPSSEEFLERRAIAAEDLSFADWVFHRRNTQADNFMTRAISGRFDVPFGECSDDLLEQALGHLDRHYSAVLLQEEMDRSMEILQRLVPRPLGPIERRNVNRERRPMASIDEAERRRVLELNALDRKLYAEAVTRFSTTFEQLPAG